jgi:hypothetical protein
MAHSLEDNFIQFTTINLDAVIEHKYVYRPNGEKVLTTEFLAEYFQERDRGFCTLFCRGRVVTETIAQLIAKITIPEVDLD